MQTSPQAVWPHLITMWKNPTVFDESEFKLNKTFFSRNKDNKIKKYFYKCEDQSVGATIKDSESTEKDIKTFFWDSFWKG